MNLDIRENIINKMKNDNTEAIISTISESVITNNELVLPGLGVMMELLWSDLDGNEKLHAAEIIKKNLNK